MLIKSLTSNGNKISLTISVDRPVKGEAITLMIYNTSYN